MARPRRHLLPGQPHHVIQRGNNRQKVFFAVDDYRAYCNWLAEAASAHDCDVHAYVLMTNHVHLLLTPEREESIPRTLQALGRRYVRAVNAAYRRTGTLWEGRYRAALIDGEAYFLTCSRYIELNPVRAAIAEHPADYPWSSYRRHALGAGDGLVTDHPIYLALGATPEGRQRAYRELFRDALDPLAIDELRAATNGGRVLGSARFKRQVAAVLGRRVAPRPRGRPSKRSGGKGQGNIS